LGIAICRYTRDFLFKTKQRERTINARTLKAPMPEPRLDSVLDTAVDGIVIIDEAGRILMFNKACERLFGFSAADVLGRNVTVIMPAEFAREHDHYLDNYTRTGERKIIGIGREVTGQHRDGTVIPVHLSVGEAMTPEGRQFIGIIRDLRARHESEQRLNQLQSDLVRMARVSAMDEMGAALAHELNQPLTALMLYLQAVERSCAKPGAANDMPSTALAILRKALHEAERAGSIIQRMRHFVEKRDPMRRLVDINPLVEDAIELTRLGSRPGIRISRAFAQSLPQVSVDPVQFQQVVVNLVRNALEAIKDQEDQHVFVATQAIEGSVAVSVQDNGPGIRPDAVPDLFKAFSSSKPKGLGLGLAISMTIAQKHGGRLEVDPGGNGQGACFTLQLPLPCETTEDPELE
jgi:two-component system sensor kinase FixL